MTPASPQTPRAARWVTTTLPARFRCSHLMAPAVLPRPQGCTTPSQPLPAPVSPWPAGTTRFRRSTAQAAWSPRRTATAKSLLSPTAAPSLRPSAAVAGPWPSRGIRPARGSRRCSAVTGGPPSTVTIRRPGSSPSRTPGASWQRTAMTEADAL